MLVMLTPDTDFAAVMANAPDCTGLGSEEVDNEMVGCGKGTVGGLVMPPTQTWSESPGLTTCPGLIVNAAV
jgi:hypothetical protein